MQKPNELTISLLGKHGLYKPASARLHYEAFVNEALIEAGHLPACENKNKKKSTMSAHLTTPSPSEPAAEPITSFMRHLGLVDGEDLHSLIVRHLGLVM